MLKTDFDRLRDQIESLARTYPKKRASLLPMLQEIQRVHGYISSHAMQVVADHLGIHPVEAYSVVTFYSFLNTAPKGRFVIRLCQTVSCDLKNKDAVARQLTNELGIEFGQITPDKRFSLEWTNCIGMCDMGPALLVNEQVFTHVTPTEVHAIIEGCRKVFGVHAQEIEKEHLI